MVGQALSNVCKLKDCRKTVEDAKSGDHRARPVWPSTWYLVGEPRPESMQEHAWAQEADLVDNPWMHMPREKFIKAMAVLIELKNGQGKGVGGRGGVVS